MNPHHTLLHSKVANFQTWLLVLFACLGVHTASYSNTIPKDLYGDWTLDMDSEETGWLRVAKEDGETVVYMRVDVGLDNPREPVEIVDNRLNFLLKEFRWKYAGRRTLSGTQDMPLISRDMVNVGMKNGKLDGLLTRTYADGSPTERIAFTGSRIPPMPPAPDLSKVRFGHPVTLFNGKDLSGWRLRYPEKSNGWSVQEGILVNTTPKTDFSATGDYGNLQTVEEFEDFWLHIEFLVEADRNSGVYLRGMYEAQVVDRDSYMQGIQGVGAIFGKIIPTKNAGKEPGEWQTYDLTLVDRHVSVVLNGEKVIDNQPIDGPTGGAMLSDPYAPGPIYLQGDHTNVKYRDIYLAPVVKD